MPNRQPASRTSFLSWSTVTIEYGTPRLKPLRIIRGRILLPVALHNWAPLRVKVLSVHAFDAAGRSNAVGASEIANLGPADESGTVGPVKKCRHCSHVTENDDALVCGYCGLDWNSGASGVRARTTTIGQVVSNRAECL